jgi:hypothetical protein
MSVLFMSAILWGFECLSNTGSDFTSAVYSSMCIEGMRVHFHTLKWRFVIECNMHLTANPLNSLLSPPWPEKVKNMQSGRVFLKRNLLIKTWRPYQTRNNRLLSFDTTRTAYKKTRPTILLLLCIRCCGNVFTKPLPNNVSRIHIQTHRLIEGTYEVLRWDRSRCHKIVSGIRKLTGRGGEYTGTDSMIT